MKELPADFPAFIKSMIQHRRLISALTVRDIEIRYRGSFLGFAWALVQPIFMLAIYAFVFSAVFKARWPGGTGSRAEFALVLFSGLLVFNVFSEVFNRAPQVVLSNANYVKRVVFPLEILSIVSVLSAMFNLLISFVVWFVFYVVAIGAPSWTVLLFPVVLVPLIMLLMGLSWIIAALGVFLRDIAQITAIITTAVMFLTPIFFPLEAIPQGLRGLLDLNPLASIVAQVRDILMWHRGIDPATYSLSFFIGLATLLVGFSLFQKTRRAFADVL